jgi:hypothetical protein
MESAVSVLALLPCALRAAIRLGRLIVAGWCSDWRGVRMEQPGKLSSASAASAARLRPSSSGNEMPPVHVLVTLLL